MGLMIYLDGKLVPEEEAKISVFDHGFLYGDGVFEGIRSYGGKVFKLDEHVDRLYASARTIMLPIPISHEEMKSAIVNTLKANNLPDGYVRAVVSRGAGSLGLDIRKTSHPMVIVIASKIQLYPEELYQKGLDLVTASTIRNHPQALNPRVKSLNYLNNILAHLEAVRAGCAEAVMLNHKGEVAECTADNLFIVKNKQVITPPLDAGILEGITRNSVLEIAHEAGYITREMTLTRHDLYIADEMFLTGTAAEIIPVVRLDGRLIGSGEPGPVVRDLRSRFQEYVKRP